MTRTEPFEDRFGNRILVDNINLKSVAKHHLPKSRFDSISLRSLNTSNFIIQETVSRPTRLPLYSEFSKVSLSGLKNGCKNMFNLTRQFLKVSLGSRWRHYWRT